ncbi:ABC transporter permease [Paenibacillus spongiae]|uniref:Transport permease protein n=1 Tax=Paenibacillus spongiae TaxID=2909671 RepID=A0ABY5SA13_9BACL|nr:ABC transporter permease [Paenibacillus spongiae]UVI30776.1 ABC transporter permease [Paenibacillus spongiae]
MNAYLKLISFDLRMYLRDWITIFWVLIYPVLMLLIFGSMYGDQPGSAPGSRYIDYYVPALCVMNVMSVSVFTLNINMITLRESGTLRRFRVTPIRKSAVLTSHAVQGLLLVLAGAAEVIIVGKLVWDIQITVQGLLLLICSILIGCIGFFSLGFALSGLTSTPGAASGLAMAIFFPMLFLSGISMPLEYLPKVMQALSDWIPMTYYVEMAQGVWQGHSLLNYGQGLVVLAIFAAVCIALALRLFRWENR